ncbi:SpoIIE family protein phosphatase [Actinocorallia sp. API 0066]|uniref:PP2C family protein-serine/threonine phosphatase n=1 Tax=Actinocorallia sp. API 0066 TaxID=2896846 RepID=UPI001E32F375|nr:SpoIIE family protein phosphatase [Actinocorallia sp. API 0066]MCD0450663.1 SpoIIE family protein phosphatase [Actinocorallia sp. API 0066]
MGPGALWPGALRWDPTYGWQILEVSPPGFGEPPVAETPGATLRDVWAIVSGLVRVAAGRPPRDLEDVFTLLDLYAGVFPHGLDAVVYALLAEEDPRAVLAAVRARYDGEVRVWPAAETAVGSRKAKGNPESDNEDAFTVVRDIHGAVILLVCDGVTGQGDGSGARAARAAVETTREYFLGDDHEGLVAGIAEADRVVVERSGGASTLLAASVAPNGRTELALVGDSPAWLVRPLPDGRRAAWRLTPAQTVLAVEIRTEPSAHWGGSILTHHLGGYADEPYTASVQTLPGDLLVLLSDGAAVESDTWFGDDLAALATVHPTASGLAAALVARAELLGGRDNATAVVAEIRPA